MGCCCPKQKDEENETDERTPLINESKIARTQSSSNQQSAHKISISKPVTQIENGHTDMKHDKFSPTETNQVFEKILSEVIHVTTVHQRPDSTISNGVLSHSDGTNPILQEMSLKIKGLLEPQKSQLTLPDGVTAPLSVLAAQPPFLSDIQLINSFAFKANICICDFTLNVPDNMAFNFGKPI